MVCIQTLRQDVARLEFELLRACPGVTGYSHFQMSRNGLDMLANYSLGFEVDVRVIYITPILNTVILTLRDFRLSDVVGELVALSPGRLWAWPELQCGVGEFIEIYTLSGVKWFPDCLPAASEPLKLSARFL